MIYSKKLTLSSAAIFLAVLISGCGGPQVKTLEPVKVTTLKSPVMAGYSSAANKLKKKSILAVKAPDLLRFEIKGFFNEPFFMLTAKGNKVQAYFVQENAYYEGELFDAGSDSLASIFLNQTGKLKVKGVDVVPVFTRKSEDSPAPATADFSSGEYKISFVFNDPELNKEISDKIFELTPPKNARKITDDEINRYLGKWKR